MSEENKSDQLLQELSSLEAQVSVMLGRCSDIQRQNRELERINKELLTENASLKKEIDELNAKFPEGGMIQQDLNLAREERDRLKKQVSELITKIDSYIQSA